jgi:mannose/fructose/N-acetylgalactosamine-specific phosphotransferase system component IIC
MTAVPLTPPPGTSILSFSITITGISLTPTTGSDISIPLAATTYIMDAAKLESDSAFIGQALALVPPGSYNKITLAVNSAAVTFCTATSGTPGCNAGSVATVPASPLISTPSSPVTLTLAANDKAGLRVMLNMGPALTISGQTITALTLAPASGSVLTAAALPPAKSSLASGQLDFVEDFTGIVTAVSGSAVTITTTEHGAIQATANSSTSFSPTCAAATFAGCVMAGQLASIDAALNADGTFTLLEYDPLEGTASDWIEGTVTSVSPPNQFQMVANDVFLKATGSIIVGNSLQDAPVAVTTGLGTSFLVDSKGLSVPPADSNLFTSSNDTSVLKPGQMVAVRVTNFVAANPPTIASATVNTVMLRFTRVTGSVSASTSLTISIKNLPPYFGALAANSFTVQLNPGSSSSAPTNFDGITAPTDLAVNDTVSIRAIYFPTSTTQPFTAAKVRKQ